MADQKLEALRKVSLFSRCSPGELEFLASHTDEVDLGAGRTLIRQGDNAGSFFLLLQGEVEIKIDDRHRRTMKSGDYFGEISMLDRGPATASAIAVTPVKAMVMSHSQFRDAIKANEGLLTQVLAVVAERLRSDSSEG